MAKKDIKLNIKNTQIAQALNLNDLKSKLAQKKADGEPAETVPHTSEKKSAEKAHKKEPAHEVPQEQLGEEAPRRKARTKSAFNEDSKEQHVRKPIVEEAKQKENASVMGIEPITATPPPKHDPAPPSAPLPTRVVLGPTGRHVDDLLKPKREAKPLAKTAEARPTPEREQKTQPVVETKEEQDEQDKQRGAKPAKFKEFKDVKPARKQDASRFDSRDSRGLREQDDEFKRARRRKGGRKGPHDYAEELTTRPTSLRIRLPITVKDLAAELKRKASEIIQKLFLQGTAVTLNDYLDDETTVQLIGHDFECEITVDTTEEKRVQITSKSIKEEITEAPLSELTLRAPVVAFMGHVDHGKTSLIDSIRKSNRAAGEAGDITQHIGAFKCHTPVGDITILDTPGHEAFSAMRARGADVTDIVVLVVAGDEGIRVQSLEAINHAKAAGVTIVVAINKCDKPNYDPDLVYRQLADANLLPEAWGGTIITVRCSAVTGEGVQSLLEMLALQAEILELKASPASRARGTVIESEMHKGLGGVASVLVQNGTLRVGDSLVFTTHFGKVKTMHDEHGKTLKEAPPSTPVEITGLSALPEAGEEFIVVKNEKEAKEIASVRALEFQQKRLQGMRMSMENMMQKAKDAEKKILNIILRADVQGSLEALKVALMKIKSDKVNLNIIFGGVGEVTESDIQLASASKAMVLGFHTGVESHADAITKQYGVVVKTHDIIYHAIDDVKLIMKSLLDKIAYEEVRGHAEVRQVFKSSQVGQIAGCIVTEGSIHRNYHARLLRNKAQIWQGHITSIRRLKDEVKEVTKGLECGIVLGSCNDIQEGDIIQAYEILYKEQDL